MDQPTPAAGVASRADIEDRVSTLLADRPCARCLFNLVGQSIVRERHYAMLIVRCPECGSVTSILEYPLLGRWANRWAALAAALWLLVAIAVSCGIAGIIFGFTVGTMETAPLPLAELIANNFEAHQALAGATQGSISGWSSIDAKWWASQDREALMDAVGGWQGAVRWWGFLLWLIAFVPLFLLASIWAVGCAHRRGLRLLLTYLPMVLIAAAFFGMGYLGPSRWMHATDLAARMLWPVLLPISAVLAVIPLIVGALLGRTLARLLVVAMLPPRLRVPLSFLWICDGKTPPKPIW